jgi:hypothetical protein
MRVTLRHWLRLAHISVQAHPFDARLKCVTSEQVQHLAATHRRTLPESSELPFPAAPPAPSIRPDVSTASVWSSVVSEVSGPITELTQQLGSLQAQVAMLQHQLALLDFPITKGAATAHKRDQDVREQFSGIFPGQVSEVFPG